MDYASKLIRKVQKKVSSKLNFRNKARARLLRAPAARECAPRILSLISKRVASFLKTRVLNPRRRVRINPDLKIQFEQHFEKLFRAAPRGAPPGKKMQNIFHHEYRARREDKRPGSGTARDLACLRFSKGVCRLFYGVGMSPRWPPPHTCGSAENTATSSCRVYVYHPEFFTRSAKIFCCPGAFNESVKIHVLSSRLFYPESEKYARAGAPEICGLIKLK